MNIRASAAVLFLGASLMAAQTTKPATQRSMDQIGTDINAAAERLSVAIDHGKASETSEARKKAAPAVLPDLRALIGLFQELRAANPDMEAQINTQLVQLRTLQLVFGDPQAQETNAKAAASGDALASGERAVANYVCAADDPERLRAIDAFGSALQHDPANDSLTGLLSFIIDVGVNGKMPSDQINARLLKVAQADTKSPAAQELAQALDSQIKLHSLVGKPATLADVKMDGAPFTTADWKGKVVLADFWATWCPPCVAEVPEIQKLYQQYHQQGLEVVGISNDNGLDDLKKFLAQNPGVVWPQLFNAKAPGMNAIASKYGIVTLPVTFLIDRQGVLRAVASSPDLTEIDSLIPKLLAEKAK